ncbi:ATP-binding cassette domain-containing protein [Gorillibacterium sp. CAU 1737]|uniref:ABC transporter ATP-binding protein n=1 Tax=Gorillibacterium sp. CAU 1737 TaxID=3140362 RepID=UPI003260E384
MIEAVDIHKQFRTPVAKEGPFAGIRSLFARDYRVKEAVNGISFTLPEGEFAGYIGPNGAGKSTTIKMLTGILRPTSGLVTIGGMNPHKERRKVARRLGVVFGHRSQLWWDLPVKESFELLGAMYSVPAAARRKREGEMIELLEMSSFLDTPVRKLSLGQRMRADLAAAMLHDPDILFLDEPTIGLDANAKESIRGFLRTLNREYGKTVLLTTHDMDDIERLCSRVLVINDGMLRYDGTIPELRERIGLPTVIRIRFQREPNVPESAAVGLTPLRASVEESAADLAGAPFRIRKWEGRQLTVECNRSEVTAMEVLRAVSEWGDVEDVETSEPEFEEIVRRIY